MHQPYDHQPWTGHDHQTGHDMVCFKRHSNRRQTTIRLIPLRSYFHFDFFQCVMALPQLPIDTCLHGLRPFVVDPVHVGASTRAVPPASLQGKGTVSRICSVVVAVLRTEAGVSMVPKRIPYNNRRGIVDGTSLGRGV